MSSDSKIFHKYRTLGYISNHIPLKLRYIESLKEYFLITVVGNAFHTYASKELSLLSISNQHHSAITAIGADKKFVFSACRGLIRTWKRGTEVVQKYETDDTPVIILLPFDKHLISVNDKSLLQVWNIDSGEIYLEVPFNKKVFKITTVLHPITYLNKILLGSEQGPMQLWNIRANKLIYTFKGFMSEVTVLEQTPAEHVVAVGLKNGNIVIHNIQVDETVMCLSQEWGPITSVSFRSDGIPVMAVGSRNGHIGLWNLDEKKLISQIRHAHDCSVRGMSFYPNEPVMVSSSDDNSIKMWMFDMPDGGARLYKILGGHCFPPNKIRFHGANGKDIISAGQDSTLRTFSTIKDHLNKNLGQASYNRKAAKRKSVKMDQKKMPPIIDFTSEITREKEWDNIVACHRGISTVTTWSRDRCTMGDLKLCHDRFKSEFLSATAQCLQLTSCGNFVLIGYDSGHIDKYNVQSGMYRGSYGIPKAHSGSVNGIISDELNSIVVSGGSDSKIKFWKFKDSSLIKKICLDCAVNSIIVHKESGMVGIGLEDFSVIVIDLDMKNIVRRFNGHSSQITDLAFSPDSKWLISSSMDCTIRVWDLPTSTLVDCFLVDEPCTSIAMSPTGEYLATTHVNNVGINLWTNKSLYEYVTLRPLPEDYYPTVKNQTPDSEETSSVKIPLIFKYYAGVPDECDQLINETEYISPEQLSDELVTLSKLPESRWKNILNLDIIKKRNKPKVLPKKPESAPFFIPTIPDLDFKFDLSTKDTKIIDDTKIDSLVPLSSFQKKLVACNNPDEYSVLLNELKEKGLSTIAIEIKTLSPDGGGSVILLQKFMILLKFSLETRQNFEVVAAYLGLFLQDHADVLSENDQLTTSLKDLLETQKKIWHGLEGKLSEILCIVNYLKSSALL
ncbi:WD repeat-containing protein 36 [Nymphon striatum]|nr:WD repeat-containing protein 36 [Nymphon striatum]